MMIKVFNRLLGMIVARNNNEINYTQFKGILEFILKD